LKFKLDNTQDWMINRPITSQQIINKSQFQTDHILTIDIRFSFHKHHLQTKWTIKWATQMVQSSPCHHMVATDEVAAGRDVFLRVVTSSALSPQVTQQSSS